MPPPVLHKWRSRAAAAALAAAIVLRARVTFSGDAVPVAFVSPPRLPGPSERPAQPAELPPRGSLPPAASSPNELVAAALLAAAAGAGGALGTRQLRGERDGHRTSCESAKSGSPIDWTGAATRWDDIQERSVADVDVWNVHGVLTISSLLLFSYQLVRICVLRQAPTEIEVWFTVAIYLPWILVAWKDTDQLQEHYRVTFYASCGWGFMSLCSLICVYYERKYPEIAFDVLAVGNVVFAVSCLYFYTYHWGRMWRHFTQNRFRPFWIPGLLGLMLLHSLTPLDFAKRVDDPKWWKTVCAIYPDEWWWVADVRIIELFVTAAALWLIILHIQGVFTGMRNAAVVVIGTIFTPLIIMVLESTWVRASSWQHYLMNGPKYW